MRSVPVKVEARADELVMTKGTSSPALFQQTRQKEARSVEVIPDISMYQSLEPPAVASANVVTSVAASSD
jgi:hypothetical protein